MLIAAGKSKKKLIFLLLLSILIGNKNGKFESDVIKSKFLSFNIFQKVFFKEIIIKNKKNYFCHFKSEISK